MELKVWVDGIQRVVCGASYTTTCQDVVLALAHAMGRTGRFTLVEKWRDAERPLTPGECPLQSLHKWGEYAAEVRYYLVQAETDKAKHQEQTRQTQKMSTEKLDKFTHNFTPPHLGHMGPESIKRSSTFSGAHNMNYAKFPSSLSSSMSATSSYNKQPLAQPQSSSTTKVRHTTLGPLPNGEIASASSSSSSPRSSSRSSPGGLSPRSASRSAPYRDDARTLHPANMPGATTSYSNQDRGYSAHKHSTQQSFPAPSQQPYPVPSQQTRQGLSHPPPRSHHPTQPQYPFPNQSHQSHPSSPKQTSSRPQLPISQHHHPSASQGVHSATSGQAHPSQRHFSQPSHQPYPQSNHSEPPVHPIPAPRQLRASSPDVEYENLPPHPTQRERSRERSSQRTTPVSFPANAGDSSKVFYQEADRDAASRGNNDSHSFHKDGRGNGSSHPHYKKRGESYPYQRGGAPQGYSDNQSSARNTQGRLRSDDAVGHTSNTSSSTVPSFTRDKVVPGPQLSKGLPSRSLSSANTARADEEVRHSGDNLSKSMPESSMKQMRRSGEAGGKLSFVESALMRQQRSSTESTGRGGTMSSFASAVAHIRQHSGDGQLKPPKSETHVRQHSSDSSLTDESFQGGLRASLNQDMSSLGTSTSNQNVALNIDHLQQQKHHHPLPSVNKPSSPLSSISPSRHNSAFTQVSPRTSTSHQGSASSPSSAAPVAYNLDHQNFHHFGPGLPNAAGSRGPGLQQSQENTHSRQASLEIEEYDLDQNFPDVFYRDAAAAGGVKTQVQQSMPLEYHLENGGVAPAQHEAEYTRLVRLVRMQEERIKMQEAQISDCTMEISRLEEQENQESAKLEVITGEVTQLEQQENQVKLELEELDRVEWVNVLDGERKREADIKSQMKSLQEKLDELESQLRQLKEEEERKTQELKAEREKLEDEKKKIEEVERKAATEVSELKEKLTALDKLTQEKEKELANLEGKIQKADTDLKQQEEEAQKIEEELKDENLKDFQAHPVPKEPPPSSVPSSTPVEPPAPISVISAADSGEAILKLLEDRLSPRSPPTSPSADGSSNSVGGMTSAQHTYKSALAAKNPNGVWV